MNSGRSSSRFIPELDGLRGLAILSVFAFHFIGVRSGPVALQTIGALAHSGWIGVDLFFVLSGFLITRNLINARGGPGYYRNFYARRALRILPLYFGFLIVLFGVLPRLISSPELSILASRQGWLWAHCSNVAIALHGFYFLNVGSFWTIHFWTLAIEEQFYLVWPLVVLIVPPHRLERVCWLVLFLAPAGRMIATGIAGLTNDAVHVLTPLRADSFASGALIAVWFTQGTLAALHKLVRATTIVSALALIGIAARHGTLTVGSLTWPLAAILYTLLATSFAGTIAITLTAAPHATLRRVLRARALRVVGLYSYGLYVIHYPLQPLIERHFGAEKLRLVGLPYALAGLTHFVIAFSICFALSAAIYHVYELPFLRIQQRFRNPPAESMATIEGK